MRTSQLFSLFFCVAVAVFAFGPQSTALAWCGRLESRWEIW